MKAMPEMWVTAYGFGIKYEHILCTFSCLLVAVIYGWILGLCFKF